MKPVNKLTLNIPNIHTSDLLGWEHENELETVISVDGVDDYDKECAFINNEKHMSLKSKKPKGLPPQSLTPHAKRNMETEKPFTVVSPENALSSRKLYSPLGFKKQDFKSKVVLQKKSEPQNVLDDDEESIETDRNDKLDALDQTPLSIVNNNTLHNNSPIKKEFKTKQQLLTEKFSSLKKIVEQKEANKYHPTEEENIDSLNRCVSVFHLKSWNADNLEGNQDHYQRERGYSPEFDFKTNIVHQNNKVSKETNETSSSNAKSNKIKIAIVPFKERYEQDNITTTDSRKVTKQTISNDSRKNTFTLNNTSTSRTFVKNENVVQEIEVEITPKLKQIVNNNDNQINVDVSFKVDHSKNKSLSKDDALKFY